MQTEQTRHSVDSEPQFSSKTDFSPDPSEINAEKILSKRKYDLDQAVEYSVWDEPSINKDLIQIPETDKLQYSKWLASKISSTTLMKTWLNTIFLTLFSGIWAVIGVFILALQGIGGIGIIAIVFFGPVIEEILKISSTLITIEKKPFLFKFPSQVFFSCVMSGIIFAIVENILYLYIYIPNPSPTLVMWRWTICVLLHATCAGISSVGLIKIWEETVSKKKKPELLNITRYVASACLTHATYNMLAIFISPIFSLTK